ncbi:MAG TPA: hypothetical protein VID67_05710 [Rhizomicrobium sp.]|jgi:hypothetical protein
MRERIPVVRTPSFPPLKRFVGEIGGFAAFFSPIPRRREGNSSTRQKKVKLDCYKQVDLFILILLDCST